jgi:ATP-dependent DNA helicase RecQ
VPDEAREAARERLRRVGVELPARAQWPTGMDRLSVPVKGRIAPAEQVGTGRAVARLTDLGWGTRLRDLVGPAAPDAPVPDDVVRAAVAVLAAWEWAERPAAVVYVPSTRHPAQVASLAARLAEVGRLPLLGALDLVRDPSGGHGSNSARRLAAVHGAFAVGEGLRTALAALAALAADRAPADPTGDAAAAEPGPPGAGGGSPSGPPLLLVDDYVDTGWTMTEAARVLRAAGAGAVLPFALAAGG